MEFNWESFKYNVSTNNVIPILGNDLSVIRLSKSNISQTKNYDAILKSGTDEGNHIRINLYKFLAIKLWGIHGKGEPINSLSNFNSIVLQLLSKGITPDDLKNAIKNETIKLTDEQIVQEPLRKIIKIKGFENFVTVNIDNFLERAFEAEGKKVNGSINFSIQDSKSDSDEKNDRALPNIFNLMGNIKWGKFAASDEESLEYLYMLKNDSTNKNKALFDMLDGKILLFIGCNFPDWFMRFFIRIIANERYTYSNRTKYVASDHILMDKDLMDFLEGNKTSIIPIGNNNSGSENLQIENSIVFLDEIFNQCGQNGESVVADLHYEGFVFLSYCRDDAATAEKIKNEFERNGIKVFFDVDSLKTGIEYDKILKNAIEECNYFIALISKNSIGDKDRYAYGTEWNHAIAFDNKRNYIRPYIIDDTLPVDMSIPREIRDKTIKTIKNIDNYGEVVRAFIKENNLIPVTLETKPNS
ncbi:MAG: toll/interleukin-1 receptor domain-containing protein [Bacteroidia bacterium]